MTLGLRYDYQEHYGGNLSPRAGLVWQPGPDDTIKLMYGEAFREPNIFELSSDPDLNPAVLTSMEICIAHSFGDLARISLSGYHSQIEDFLGSVGSLIGTGVGQVETQTVQGLEWQFDIRKGPVDAFLGGAWIINAEQDVRDSDTGAVFTRDLLGLPEKKISIGASCQVHDHVFLSLISSHIESYDALSGNPTITEPIRIESAHEINLTVGICDMEFSKLEWDGFLTVTNLTDRTNYEANIRRSGPHIFQQPERRMMIGGRIRF
jgi:outer membrane receptor protein involved in Fe transport